LAAELGLFFLLRRLKRLVIGRAGVFVPGDEGEWDYVPCYTKEQSEEFSGKLNELRRLVERMPIEDAVKLEGYMKRKLETLKRQESAK
jgi:hypothetical protein